ncbi:MAG: aminotransferase class I/II-fold pyridoxal phosphate-dependent enzyme [Bacteroidia bacterium]|nr:aminotransferase class I/II-fold pyridoxal phosphate-dependent enzyme [Bacteroidia bacterium]
MYLRGQEWTYVRACLDSSWISSAGPETDRFEEALAAWMEVPYVVAVTSGAQALHLALILAGVKPGDYVITADLTYVATANAIHHAGATPLLVDADPHTWQLDIDLLEARLTTETYQTPEGLYLRADGRRIGALMPVHAWGWGPDMDNLSALAAQYGLPLIEDAADAMGSRDAGRHAGTAGLIGCMSFNGNKIITTGGGGALMTADAALARQARHLSVQAKTDPLAYDHDAAGFTCRMPALLAALGRAQLEQLPHLLALKANLAARYHELLADYPAPHTPEQFLPNNWVYPFLHPAADRLLRELVARGVPARPLWRPLHQLTLYAHCPYWTESHVSAGLAARGITLPVDPAQPVAEFEAVAAAIRALNSSNI